MEFNPVSLKNKWFHVPIGIFHHNVYAFVGSLEGMRDSATGEVFEKFGCSCSESDAIRKHIHLFCESHKGEKGAGDAFGRDNFSIIRVSDMITGDIDHIAILGHECLHVAAGLIDYINIQEGPNNELLCYTHEYIFRELLERMCECGLGQKYDNTEKPAKTEPAVPPSAPGYARALNLTPEDQSLLEACAKKAAVSLEARSLYVDEVCMMDDAFFVKIKCRDAAKIGYELTIFRTKLIGEMGRCGVVADHVLLQDSTTLKGLAIKVVPPLRKAPDKECETPESPNHPDVTGFLFLNDSQSDRDMIGAMAHKAAEETKSIVSDTKVVKKEMPGYLFDIQIKAYGRRDFEDFEESMYVLLVKKGYLPKFSRHDIAYYPDGNVSQGMIAVGNSDMYR